MNPIQNIYKKRIEAVQSQLNDGEILLLFAAKGKIRNRDVEYRFRQDSDFFYLTGIDEPDTILVLTAKESRAFCLPKDKDSEIWTGIRLGKKYIQKVLGLSHAHDLSEWDSELGNILTNQHTVFYFFGRDPDRDRQILTACQSVSRRARDGMFGPEKIIQPGFLHEMRLHKSPEEVMAISESAHITDLAHRAAMEKATPGMKEYEVEAILESIYLHHGAWGGGYEHIVATGKNACILHYTRKNSILKKGDLLLIDSGAEKNYYTADVTRTFPVGKEFTSIQAHIYELVLTAQKNAIRQCVAGKEFMAIQDSTVRFFSECLKDLGLLHGSIEKILEKKEYKKYYMHKIGHYLGMDVHDVGTYYTNGKPRKLENGMVVTIEPGLYFDPSDTKIPKEFRGIGIRIEDNILVDGRNPRNLTENIPKEMDEIVALRADA